MYIYIIIDTNAYTILHIQIQAFTHTSRTNHKGTCQGSFLGSSFGKILCTTCTSEPKEYIIVKTISGSATTLNHHRKTIRDYHLLIWHNYMGHGPCTDDLQVSHGSFSIAMLTCWRLYTVPLNVGHVPGCFQEGGVSGWSREVLVRVPSWFREVLARAWGRFGTPSAGFILITCQLNEIHLPLCPFKEDWMSK